MTETGFRPEERAAMLREEIRRRYSEKGAYFDPELFLEGYDALASEFEHADAARRRQMLMERYFDAFEPIDDPEIEASQFEDRFIVKPPERLATSESGVKENNVLQLLDASAMRFTMRDYGRVWQIGPTRVFDLPPGNFIEVPHLEEQDVIGTTALSACTAVVAWKDDGAFMAHIRMSNPKEIQGLLKLLPARGYSKQRTRLFFPFWIDKDGTKQDQWNNHLADLAREQNVQLDWFPYVGYETFNPDDIRHTTVLLGRDTLRSVGTSYAYREKHSKHSGGYLQRRTVIRPQTIRDYE